MWIDNPATLSVFDLLYLSIITHYTDHTALANIVDVDHVM